MNKNFSPLKSFFSPHSSHWTQILHFYPNSPQILHLLAIFSGDTLTRGYPVWGTLTSWNKGTLTLFQLLAILPHSKVFEKFVTNRQSTLQVNYRSDMSNTNNISIIRFWFFKRHLLLYSLSFEPYFVFGICERILYRFDLSILLSKYHHSRLHEQKKTKCIIQTRISLLLVYGKLFSIVKLNRCS